MEILSLVFEQLYCTNRSCNGLLKLYERLIQDGLQIFLLLKCTHCHNVVAEFPTSLPIGVAALDTINFRSVRSRGKSDINQRALMAVHTTSASWEDFRLLCCLLDIRPPDKNMSKTLLNKFMGASVAIAKISMKFAGEHAYSQASVVERSSSGLRECAVSFDASWHLRGHYSNQGFAAAIDANFGKVLDYSLYDRVCYSCSKWPEFRRSSCPEEIEEWWQAHKNQCTSNYQGTSQSMESSRAIDVWRRSIATHNLAYGTYIGDGDSSSFKNLIQSDPYDGEVPIRKEECIGHVQKRLKKRIMKKSKGLTSLSQSKADRIAHLYALVIVQNRGQSASEIHDGLQVLLKHTKEAHDNFPTGEGSWCYFQKKIALYQSDSGNPPPTTREPICLQPSLRAPLKCSRSSDHWVFVAPSPWGKLRTQTRACTTCCGTTRPKANMLAIKSLTASTALAVLSFNDGSLCYSRVMEELGLTISHHTLVYLSKRDCLRNMEKGRRIRETYKRRRRQMNAHTLVADSSRRRRDKKVYSSGHHVSELLESSDESGSDTLCFSCNCPLMAKSKKDMWIGCEACEEWFHWACVGIRSKSSVPTTFFCEGCST